MERKTSEIVEMMDNFIDKKENDKLKKLLSEFPSYGQHYVEVKNLEISLNLTKINMIALTMSYQLGKKSR